MDIARNIFLILHFVGLASLLGAVLVQMKEVAAGKGKVTVAMLHGAVTQLVTGIALVGIAEAGDGDGPNHMKVGIKLAIAAVILVIVLAKRSKQNVASWVVPAIGALTFINVVIAVSWH